MSLSDYLKELIAKDLASRSDVLQAWRWRDSRSLADAWYAALALRRRVVWVTTDRRAAVTARRHEVSVQILG